MRRPFLIVFCLITLTACSNSSDFETGEIKAIKMLTEAINARSKPTRLLDTRRVVTRNKIDDARIPVLFVELENGQNGTLTLYPGENIGETWLGADGATITLQSGIIKATRGMKSDVMGSASSMPPWLDIKDKSDHTRQISYLGGDNQTNTKTFSCIMKKHNKPSTITIFDVTFETQKFLEVCINTAEKLENSYFVDDKNVVRRSKQYHGPALGYLLIERLDR